MTIVSASTIISAPPPTVRSIFLDWPKITSFDKTYMKSITPLLPNGEPDPCKTTGFHVVAGDKVRGVFWGGEAIAEILENSETRLVWKGVWHGLVALRTFAYEPISEGPDAGKCRFTQSEEAIGFMGAVLVVDGWLGGNLKKKFLVFNNDLKEYCEQKRL